MTVKLIKNKNKNAMISVPRLFGRKHGKSNQSVLKEVNPEYLEGLMLKLKLQYFGHVMQRANALEKTLMLEKIEGKRSRVGRGWGGWVASSTHWTSIWANSGR